MPLAIVRRLACITALLAFTAVLSDSPASEDLQTIKLRMDQKLAEFQKRAPEWVSAGGDTAKIDELAKKLETHLKAGRLAEGEAVVDELLALVSTPVSSSTQTASSTSSAEPEAKQVRLGKIPPGAEIVYHKDNEIYVMDADGSNPTRITFDNSRRLEHVAVSHDRTKIVANYWADPVKQGHTSHMLLYDLEKGTETELLPHFHMAGNGGVDWGPDDFIYFAGVEKLPVTAPSSRQDHIANLGANDVYKVKYDGTRLERLTHTEDRGEADVSVSEDGRYVAYMATYLDPPNDYTEIWMRDSDGTNPRLVYKGGKAKIDSVHDPEHSPDNSRIVFSQVNPDFRNFRDHPDANTAHDIYSIRIDGTNLERLTEPGPIAIIPDWKESSILYLHLTDREEPNYLGLVVMSEDGTKIKRIRNHAGIGKWIPGN